MKYTVAVDTSKYEGSIVDDWCKEQIGPCKGLWDWEWADHISDWVEYKFEKEEDAVLFKLIWC